MDKRKLIAICLICMISFHAYGTVNLGLVLRSFAASNIYSVTNTIYFNATSLSKGAETIKLEITKDFADSPKDDPIFKADVVDSEGFVYQELTDSLKLQKTTELEDATSYPGFFNNLNFNLTSTAKAMLTTYTNYSMARNVTDFYENFTYASTVFPVTERRILFDSPYNIVNEYCDEKGLVFNAIINSTYTENIGVNQLNAFDSELIKTDFFVTEPLDENGQPLSMSKDSLGELTKLGEDLKVVQLGVLLVVVIVACFTLAAAAYTIVECMRIQAMKELAKKQIWADLNATVTAINGETEVQIELAANKAANEALILEMYSNGTISFEECLTLLTKVGADYSSLLSNRTQNFNEILDTYFEHVEDQWSEYKNALGISTSWMNWIQILLIAAVVLFGMYIVYAVLIKKAPQHAVNPVVNIVK